MAFCPFAVQQIIPESNQQGWITPTTLIFHEAVSSADSLRDYWNSPGVELESHFYIGRTGTIYQYLDTNVRADANMNANAFAISVETWDNSNADPNAGWTDAQVSAAKRLAAWVCDTHGIKRGPATTWNGGGIGGHNWFPDPWAGGPRQCPGVTRNAQIRNQIIPFVANGGTSTQEDDLSAAAEEMIRQMYVSMSKMSAQRGVDVGDAFVSMFDSLKPVTVEIGPKGSDGKVPMLAIRPNEAAANVYAMTFFGSNYGFGEAIVKQLASLAGGTVEVDEEALAQHINDSLAPAIAQAVVEVALPAIREVMGEDNKDQAQAVVDLIRQKLGGAA